MVLITERVRRVTGSRATLAGLLVVERLSSLIGVAPYVGSPLIGTAVCEVDIGSPLWLEA